MRDQPIKLTYNDNDVISISTDEDIEEALEQVMHGQTLKIYITSTLDSN